MSIVQPAVFEAVFHEMMATNKFFKLSRRRREQLRGSGLTAERRFLGLFGLNSYQVARLWNALERNSLEDLKGWKPKHLLDALFFLKVYSCEHVGAIFGDCDEKTLRKWNWKVIKAIGDLPCVCTGTFLFCS